jgi:hypothetical protein
LIAETQDESKIRYFLEECSIGMADERNVIATGIIETYRSIAASKL